jgi:hypothetical protein
LGGSWFKASQANSSQNCILKITRAKSTGGVAQAIEHPSSNFNTTTKKKKKERKEMVLSSISFHIFLNLSVGGGKHVFLKNLYCWHRASKDVRARQPSTTV